MGDIICALKSLSVREAKPLLGERLLWQRAYYDHVVRDERDYGEAWDYLEYNPLRWREDSLYAEWAPDEDGIVKMS